MAYLPSPRPSFFLFVGVFLNNFYLIFFSYTTSHCDVFVPSLCKCMLLFFLSLLLLPHTCIHTILRFHVFALRALLLSRVEKLWYEIPTYLPTIHSHTTHAHIHPHPYIYTHTIAFCPIHTLHIHMDSFSFYVFIFSFSSYIWLLFHLVLYMIRLRGSGSYICDCYAYTYTVPCVLCIHQ